ncbi:Oidioi.mRNA.OKI2018_I69.chr2.g5443.t1.cds [Oikopleura dioica]|uniref:Oidioi.mRNA.OKI2018_I69.chr2.g5443.t1.cds n=1 Tax=Oikopleura dioica TaxID=34765 RepID=A0ABN7T4P1_OIKDI|nr:Oidioi.mRNA.OKI2018_I69.chr2.g5443.t1.cds [Oikopleura dioica]
MKLFRFFGVFCAAFAQADETDEPLNALAVEVEDFKFLIDDILRSRDQESKHLTARIIELEDKLAQQQMLYYQAKLKQSGITEEVVKEASSKQEKEDNNEFGPNYQGILDFFNEGF